MAVRSLSLMRSGPLSRIHPAGKAVRTVSTFLAALLIFSAAFFGASCPAFAQQDQLNQVHIQPPPAKPAAKTPPANLKSGLKVRPAKSYQVNVNLVLIPFTVTDPMDRLVTGLEKSNFEV